MPLVALSSGASVQESLVEVLLGFVRLASGSAASSARGRAGVLDPHSEEAIVLAMHMLNMTSALLAVHGSTDGDQATRLGSLEGLLTLLALVRTHAWPVLNPPPVLRALKVLVAVLETAPEARVTAAQLIFARKNDDMNFCELLVVIIDTAVEALCSMGRAHAKATGEGLCSLPTFVSFPLFSSVLFLAFLCS